jgi:hypothetical protein
MWIHDDSRSYAAVSIPDVSEMPIGIDLSHSVIDGKADDYRVGTRTDPASGESHERNHGDKQIQKTHGKLLKKAKVS